MGGKAGRIILPLVAIAATVATGPGGLGLWGETAAAGAAAGTAATGAAGAATGAAALSTGATALNFGTLFPAVATAATTAAPAVASESFFSSLLSSATELSPIQKLALGFQAASTGGNIVSGNINAAGQRAAIAFQQNQQKLQESQDRLDIANRELDSQRRLRSVLATQNNYFAATGIDSSQGSAARLADAAVGSQGFEAGLFASRRNLDSAAASNRLAALDLKRRRIGGYGTAFGSLLDFGGTYASTVGRNRRLGRA